MAVDPNFASNGFIYLYYPMENGTGDTGTKASRLSRFTMSGETADPSTEFVVLGSQNPHVLHNPARRRRLHPRGHLRSRWRRSRVRPRRHLLPRCRRLVELGQRRRPGAPSTEPRLLRRKDPAHHRARKGHLDEPVLDRQRRRSPVEDLGLRVPQPVPARRPSDLGHPLRRRGRAGTTGRRSTRSSPAATTAGRATRGPRNRVATHRSRCVKPCTARAPARSRCPCSPSPTPQATAAQRGALFLQGSSFPPVYQKSFMFGDYARNFIHYIELDELRRLCREASRASPRSPTDQST